MRKAILNFLVIKEGKGAVTPSKGPPWPIRAPRPPRPPWMIKAIAPVRPRPPSAPAGNQATAAIRATDPANVLDAIVGGDGGRERRVEPIHRQRRSGCGGEANAAKRDGGRDQSQFETCLHFSLHPLPPTRFSPCAPFFFPSVSGRFLFRSGDPTGYGRNARIACSARRLFRTARRALSRRAESLAAFFLARANSTYGSTYCEDDRVGVLERT